ncbi:MAG: hypothetical protein H7X77_09720 [Anaerolineae bacterium]|nr:hypothetical protein [Anaerolineae bacterium]
MLVDKMENRILVGTVMFVGIMIMLGWVAINENGRMASFTRQYDARSAEHGGKLFSAYCSTCHGNDGRGINGRAPGLNNPQFFGHDFIPADRDLRDDFTSQLALLNEEKTDLQAELAADLTAETRAPIETRIAEIDTELAATETMEETKVTLQTERDGLQAQLDAEPLTPERIAEIEARIPAIDAEIEALNPQLTEVQTRIDAFTTSIQTAVDNGYDINEPDRINQANWASSHESYIFTTLVHGRGQNAALWGGNIMPAWAQSAGGSLRDDQLQNLVTYIMDWDKGDDWTLEDLLAVNQFAQVPGEGAGRPEPSEPGAGTDVAAVVTQISTLTGDPVRGEAIYSNKDWSQVAERLGCGGCHTNGSQGPLTEGTWDRVVTERLTDPVLASYTVEQYLVESILVPGAYIVPTYADGVMPATFGARASVQDIADIVAYLRTTSADYVAPEITATEEPGATEEAVATDEAMATEEPAAP